MTAIIIIVLVSTLYTQYSSLNYGTLQETNWKTRKNQSLGYNTLESQVTLTLNIWNKVKMLSPKEMITGVTQRMFPELSN